MPKGILGSTDFCSVVQIELLSEEDLENCARCSSMKQVGKMYKTSIHVMFNQSIITKPCYNNTLYGTNFFLKKKL